MKSLKEFVKVFFSLQLAVCVSFTPMFWDFNICENATSQSGSLSTVRQWSTNEGNQHKMECYSFWLQKGVKISIWIWVSKPQPTIAIWLCLSFHWKSELHTLHRDLSFDAILRAFFVVRILKNLVNFKISLNFKSGFRLKNSSYELILPRV